MCGFELVERRVELGGDVTEIGRISLEIARGDDAVIGASVELEEEERLGLVAERTRGEKDVEAPLQVDKVRNVESELVENESNLLGVLGVMRLEHANHVLGEREHNERVGKVERRQIQTR